MKYFEDFNVGEIAVTRARTITETDIVNFAALTGDWYPLHTDIEYAKKGPFGERIAHGLLILSIANRANATLRHGDCCFLRHGQVKVHCAD